MHQFTDLLISNQAAAFTVTLLHCYIYLISFLTDIQR
jgi:uncharacterized protein YqhQ